MFVTDKESVQQFEARIRNERKQQNDKVKMAFTFIQTVPFSSVIKSRHLNFFGHLARMDENADASQAIFEPPVENWRRPPGRLCTTWMKNIHDDESLLDLGIHEARDLAQNRPLFA